MNQEIKAEWVAALRSGEFKQSSFRLHKVSALGEHTYCVMGVLAEIALRHGVVKTTTKSFPMDDGSYTVAYDDFYVYLPAHVLEWAELVTSIRGIQLSALNDDLELPFSVLADLIAKHL